MPVNTVILNPFQTENRQFKTVILAFVYKIKKEKRLKCFNLKCFNVLFK